MLLDHYFVQLSGKGSIFKCFFEFNRKSFFKSDARFFLKGHLLNKYYSHVNHIRTTYKKFFPSLIWQKHIF